MDDAEIRGQLERIHNDIANIREKGEETAEIVAQQLAIAQFRRNSIDEKLADIHTVATLAGEQAKENTALIERAFLFARVGRWLFLGFVSILAAIGFDWDAIATHFRGPK